MAPKFTSDHIVTAATVYARGIGAAALLKQAKGLSSPKLPQAPQAPPFRHFFGSFCLLDLLVCSFTK